MGVVKDASAIKQRIKEFEKDEAWKAKVCINSYHKNM